MRASRCTTMRTDMRTSCVAPHVYSTPSSGSDPRVGVSGDRTAVFATACSAGGDEHTSRGAPTLRADAAPFGLYRQTGTTCAYNNGIKRAELS